ncbi:hypothetical protein CB1_000465017 [Camelus ferus]|nr:hypothetical protein CB1_000465017 [Camelus ferus]
MDDSCEEYEDQNQSLLGPYQSKSLADDENGSKGSIFNPERVIAHCFKRFKQKDFHLPPSRRRIIVLPQKEAPMPINAPPQPQAPPQPTPSFKTLEVREVQEQPEDLKAWLSQRLKLRQDLESFSNTERWLQSKPRLTPSEAKVLHKIHKEHKVQPMAQQATAKATKKKSFQPSRQVPQLRLPTPSALLALYSHLRSRRIRILELFNKAGRCENQRISREEFIRVLKSVEVPLKSQEVEDIVIYLSSLGKDNSIAMGSLANTYQQWSLAQQKSTLATAAEFDTKVEARPTTLEEMEEVGKRYRERKRQSKLAIPSIQYSECCRLVRSGNKHFDEHCLPSTIHGDMTEIINATRRDCFLVYLQCWKLCKAFGLPLTEDILVRALLYPGDKIIFQKDQVRPIRQPGGYYSDLKILHQNLTLLRSQGVPEPVAKKTDKLSWVGPAKKEPWPLPVSRGDCPCVFLFSRKLKAKMPSGPQLTHPNFFWPGHLLDKLQLFLPTVTVDRSLALFSCVQHRPQAYSATYRPNHWWPIKDMHYMTYGYYDAPKIYHIN